MPPPLLRVPYTDPLPLPRIIPQSATTTAGAIAALLDFLSPNNNNTTTTFPQSKLQPQPPIPQRPLINTQNKTVLLTGAGISVASGLADYRGTKGTYTLNKTYRPIYYNEFCANHEARKRYWARSFLGWTNLERARPNAAHRAVGRLGELGVIGSCITQNVDSFHPTTHPSLPTLELHGYLRTLTCLTCNTPHPRNVFQTTLSHLNPTWQSHLTTLLSSGALTTENPTERHRLGLKTNPDGDVDLPGAQYSTFRYPPCPTCLAKKTPGVEVDEDGAWREGSTAGILKPSVVMFGESIPADVKVAAEHAVDTARNILVVGSSLATYSAWRLVKRAKERGLPIGILNIGGARGEDVFFKDLLEESEGEGTRDGNLGRRGVRCSVSADEVLPEIVRVFEEEEEEEGKKEGKKMLSI